MGCCGIVAPIVLASMFLASWWRGVCLPLALHCPLCTSEHGVLVHESCSIPVDPLLLCCSCPCTASASSEYVCLLESHLVESSNAQWYALASKQCYSLATIGYHLFYFGDCPEAAEELKKVREELCWEGLVGSWDLGCRRMFIVSPPPSPTPAGSGASQSRPQGEIIEVLSRSSAGQTVSLLVYTSLFVS